MKKLSLLLVCVCGLVCMGMAQSPETPHASGVHTPGPTYPADALKANITGSGTCQVVFDASGHVDKAVMLKSTGSKVLDENTLGFARKNWTGQPNTKVAVPIDYQLAKKPKAAVRVSVPMPPYPYQARAANTQGSGTVKVTFDETGKVVSAVMTKSTGSSILDDNSINYALRNWHCTGGEKRTVVVPVAYRIR